MDASQPTVESSRAARLAALADRLDRFERTRRELDELRDEIERLLQGLSTDVSSTLGAANGPSVLAPQRPKARSSGAVRRPGRTQRAIVDAITTMGMPLNPHEIADAIGKPVSNVRNALQPMVAAGSIVRSGQRGSYRYGLGNVATGVDEATDVANAPRGGAHGPPRGETAGPPRPVRPPGTQTGAAALPRQHPMRDRLHVDRGA